MINGLAENLPVMGYPLYRLASDSGWVPASILVGLLFGAAHLGNSGENPLGIASVFLGGVLFATTIRLTGDLWLSVGIHAGLVPADDLVFSVPDSGSVIPAGHLLVSELTGPTWLSGGDAGREGLCDTETPSPSSLLLGLLPRRGKFRCVLCKRNGRGHVLI